MAKFLTWDEVDRAMDLVEDGDQEGIVSVFWTFEGRTFEDRDARGARKTVSVMSFCIRYGMHRGTFAGWLRRHRHLIEPSARESA